MNKELIEVWWKLVGKHKWNPSPQPVRKLFIESQNETN